jgi:hypothetical protein
VFTAFWQNIKEVVINDHEIDFNPIKIFITFLVVKRQAKCISSL